MKITALVLSAAISFAKVHEHAAYGLSVEYPDNWKILVHKEPSYTRPGPLCSLLPGIPDVVVNITTRPKKERELDWLKSEKGSEKLRMALLREYNRARPGIAMRNFAIVDDKMGLGFRADYHWKAQGKLYAAYQRGFISILQYFIVTVRGPIAQEPLLENLAREVSLAYPKISLPEERKYR